MQRTRFILRRWWLGFALLVTLGLVADLFFSPFGSAAQLYEHHPRRYAFIAGHAALFGLMVAATYSNRNLLWWAAIGIISLKLYRLLKYYTLFDYLSSSNTYNQDYMAIFYRLQAGYRWVYLLSACFLIHTP